MSAYKNPEVSSPTSGPTRRSILKAFAVGGALMVIVELAAGASKTATNAQDQVLNAIVRVGADDVVTLVMPRVEMGQGTYTSLPLLIAEELEIDPAWVRLEHAPADDKLYANPSLGIQATGGSTSVSSAWIPMRQAGAAARIMLIQAAAKAWGVEPSACRAENGSVVHAATGRRLSYGKLAVQAAAVPVPAEIALKPVNTFRRIGGDQLRLDAAGKVNGTAQFGIDVILPGMLVAAVAASPVAGGKVRSVDAAAALRVRGVQQVVQLDDVVGIVAKHMGAARKGLAAANVQWDDGSAAGYSSERMIAELEQASRRDGATARSEGNVATARAAGARSFDVVYQQPLLAHATMEPMNCTAHVRPDGCELWLGTQVPTRAQATAAEVTGLPIEKVTVHNQLLGGGFGRRLDVDYVTQAVRVAQKVKAPLKVVWTREEDMQHDTYRPYHYNRLSATLDATGHPTAWHHRVTGSSVLARWAPAAYKDDIDGDAIRDAAGPYAFPNVLVQYVRQDPPQGLNTGWWRGVGHMQNGFPVECFLDELAHASGRDPIEYRKPLLDKHPRAKRVLDLLADKVQWSRPLPKGHGRGIALTFAFGTYAAQVTEVAVDPDGTVRPLRIVTVVDCGVVVSPKSVVAQVQGGSIFGLSAVLFGNISIKNGRVEQSNFHDYRVLRINETPVIETHIVPSIDTPGGIGEVATVLVTPSVLNAVFAATGKRVRRLPFEPNELRTA
ncbi:xanthine dehydrogenase family protein molybdopterin-binding subunit [Rhodoferax sediminis]|uniref:Xanthine dehydrogenase family protein molybdopterin-binding subunit n=1 Tax=Rhodoferax sediminis TaxID=2509614 RepID=A0A515DE61_9BURK|nr:molybdopterin cofactor-binding domain-containing protein [Rhodoferax sediminis]QDL38708.1 xanthine dehydrogenase family protein molybdopterin-binding subunit [Rhodoferax sediminis]